MAPMNPNVDPEAPLHEFDDYPLKFVLIKAGKLLVTNQKTGKTTECPWYTDQEDNPWLVKKRKSFKSLIKQGDREGDYDNLK